MPKRLLNINVIIFIFRIGNLLMDKKLISWMGVAITNHDFTPRGYQLEKRYFSTFIKADDIAFYVFCPYTTLLKFVEGKKAKFPKKLHWEGLHKIHFILHKFGVAPAEEVIAEIKDYERKPKLKEFRELAEKMFILAKLEENNWNISRTARAIETPRSNLYKKLEQYHIKIKAGVGEVVAPPEPEAAGGEESPNSTEQDGR